MFACTVCKEQPGDWNRFPAGTHQEYGDLLVLYEELQINTVPRAALS